MYKDEDTYLFASRPSRSFASFVVRDRVRRSQSSPERGA
jgi:hypothetical protein